ncbi:MAG TPA: DUF819 family protein [Xanthomonadales bacterium]|nr:DUF819 family protein [Xanthomonadales bacterium]
MPIISADSTTALAAIIFGLAWLGFWVDGKPISRVIPGVPWVIGIGLLLSNTGIIPSEAPAYGFVGQYLLPLGVPFLLFKANLRSVFSDGGWVLPAFVISSIGICAGAISGFFMFNLGPEAAEIAGTYAAAFIGGVVNFVAVSEAVEMSPTQFSVALSASAPVSILGLIVLATLPAIPLIRRHFPSEIIGKADQIAITGTEDTAPRFRPDHVALGSAISFAICAVSGYVSNRLGLGNYNLFFITIITVVLANIAPRQFARLEGDFAIGMLCMYAFFAIIGAGTDAIGFIRSAPILFVYCGYMIAVQFVVLLIGAKLFKIDLATALIGSAAAIVGAAVAAALATTKGWKTLITPGITIGILGYVVANFIGVAIFKWLS